MNHSAIRFGGTFLLALGLTACGGSAVETDPNSRPGESGPSTPVDKPSTDPPPPPGESREFCGKSTVIDPERSWEQCEDGTLHRPAEAVCELKSSPRDGTCDPGFSGSSECEKDTDCSDGIDGHCNRHFSGCWCDYGCLSDSDCAEGQLCDCGPGVGRCISAPACRVDSDCSEGELCALVKDACGFRGATCLSAESECRTDDDCSENPADPICVATESGAKCSPEAFCH